MGIQQGSKIFSLTTTAHHGVGENMPMIVTKGNQRKSQRSKGGSSNDARKGGENMDQALATFKSKILQ